MRLVDVYSGAPTHDHIQGGSLVIPDALIVTKQTVSHFHTVIIKCLTQCITVLMYQRLSMASYQTTESSLGRHVVSPASVCPRHRPRHRYVQGQMSPLVREELITATTIVRSAVIWSSSTILNLVTHRDSHHYFKHAIIATENPFLNKNMPPMLLKTLVVRIQTDVPNITNNDMLRLSPY